MKQLIKEMQDYALINHVPIMDANGLNFMRQYIKEHDVKSILEIGSAIGYSAIQMAEIADDIHVETIERDQERYMLAVNNIEKAGYQERIKIQLADALDYVTEGTFDLIFIDAAKAQYIKFFERYQGNLKPGGVIISDNLKFHGMVESDERIKNRGTRQLVKKIRLYIDYLKNNPDFETEFIDIGDGLGVSRRKVL